MKITALVVALLLAAACGDEVKQGSALSQPTPARTNIPVPPKDTGVHFDTPEASMRYLAAAWNRKDLVQLKHVTDPMARKLLIDMYSEATDLRLNKCTFTKARGDYECFFTHGFPKGYKSQGPVGTAEFTVGPADKPGWYMTHFVDCGG